MASAPSDNGHGRVVPLRVIVCGVHRTGTASLRRALWQLGFHDCYHMHSLQQNLSDHPQSWIRALQAKRAGSGTFDKADWDHLLGHYQATCDLPAALFSVELAKHYPEAKVVILNRDPGRWYESVLQTVDVVVKPGSLLDRLTDLYCYALDPQRRHWINFLRLLFSADLGFDHRAEKEKAVSWFSGQYEEFRHEIPAERRIEYQIRDGWKPLCDHLGVPVPMIRNEMGELVEAPFPHVNERDTFAKDIKNLQRQSVTRATANIMAVVGNIAVAGACVYGSLLLWDRICA
ncbi:hypothetical protein DCS_02467 [Drechmeria coniospora]|uniref:NAD dependent epimerase/dehydratase n=1 Tax=Drechmeria coniospora TaxID=98403 RepID=A0A151GW33_DRECN|nr:hypothetical protein DCS_02467 [Drechmeria coniospora]KYK61325.1 hypothetical protein DCS_02467 [Drechmeria coniospora]ODA81090.1 hypothetical protein RJ55_04053 [Drechmeria coniospora]